MSQLEKNTVKAEHQLPESQYVSFPTPQTSGVRILFAGNSITRHGVLPSIGWYHDFGMAASAEENDYVHLLMKKWRERNVDFFLAVKQAAAWEVQVNEGRAEEENFEDLACFKPGFIIFRLAENVSTEIDGEYFLNALDDLIKKLNKGNGEVIYTTSFWKNKTVSDAIRKKAGEGRLVELEDLGEDASMKAYGKFEHSGICAHPGDKGMAAIADRIDGALQRWF